MDDKELRERIAKLPAWVRDHISKLQHESTVWEGQYEELRETLEVPDSGDSDVFAEIGDTDRPLGKGVTVVFRVGRESYTVMLTEGGGLSVSATQGLFIELSQSYEAILRMKKRD